MSEYKIRVTKDKIPVPINTKIIETVSTMCRMADQVFGGAIALEYYGKRDLRVVTKSDEYQPHENTLTYIMRPWDMITLDFIAKKMNQAILKYNKICEIKVIEVKL